MGGAYGRLPEKLEKEYGSSGMTAMQYEQASQASPAYSSP